MKRLGPSMFFCLLSTAVGAQTNTGRMSGRITDVTRAVLPGVTVTITDEETTTTRAVVTDEHGDYAVANLRAGTYAVAAEHLGFRKSVRSGLVLTNDGRLTVDFMLEVGEISTAAVQGLFGDHSISVGRAFELQRVTAVPDKARRAFAPDRQLHPLQSADRCQFAQRIAGGSVRSHIQLRPGHIPSAAHLRRDLYLQPAILPSRHRIGQSNVGRI